MQTHGSCADSQAAADSPAKAGDTPRRKSLTPIIKAVGNFCNLRCSYCFYSRQDQSRHTVMEAALLETFIRQYFDLFRGPACFVWHGGEPLLAGLEFYELALHLQRTHAAPGQRFENAVQTNATLIDDRWARFFRANHWRVGVSVDGTPEVHDQFRLDRRGTGSSGAVRAGIEVLRRHRVPFGVVLVLTRSAIEHVGKSFRHLTTEIGADHISINCLVDQEGYSCASTACVPSGGLARAVRSCIANWPDRDAERIQLRELDSFVAGALGRRSRACSFNGDCRNYFCLNHDGGIYPCDDMTNRPELRFGDLRLERLESILDGPVRRGILERFEARTGPCTACAWWEVCHNGCPGQRRGGITGTYALCADRKEMFTLTTQMLQRDDQGIANDLEHAL